MTSPNRRPTSLNLPELTTLTLSRNENGKILNTRMVNGMQVVLETSYPLSEFIAGSPPESPFEIPDMTNYEDRLSTFRCREWRLRFIRPTQMAKAGFYFENHLCCVKCAFCSLEITYWEPGDDPLVVHELKSPQCQFIKEKDLNVICMHDSPLTEENLLEWKDNLQGLCRVKRTNSFVLEKFSKAQARLDSFEKCNIRLKKDTSILCDAGFFYIGDGNNDATLCFYCFEGYQNWEEDDDPWAEHARQSPFCAHVLLCKGLQFVKDACGAERRSLRSYYETMVSLGILENDVVFSFDENPDLPESTEIVHVSYTESTEMANVSSTESTEIVNVSSTESTEIVNVSSTESTEIVNVSSTESTEIVNVSSTESADIINASSTESPEIVNVSSTEPTEVVNVSPRTLSKPEQTESFICKICWDEKMTTVFIPCGHIFACVQCAVFLDHCAVCREPRTMTMRVVLLFEEEYDVACTSLKQFFPEPKGPVMCKVCHKKEMKAANIPCTHVYACLVCAKKMKNCMVCSEKIDNIMTVYL